ncbi:hypothetical protein [Nocardia amamiensis]|uniref:hypothetical protein n=1 Tax=Nocardia amamiensis TaxID=404578 RepID=UPI0033EA7B80
MLLLTATTLDYFEAVYGEAPSNFVAITAVVGLCCAAGGMALASWRTYRWLKPNAALIRPRHLPLAAYSTVVYGLCSLVFTGLITLVGVDSPGGPGGLIVFFSFVLGLLAPGIVIGVMLAGTTPSSARNPRPAA